MTQQFDFCPCSEAEEGFDVFQVRADLFAGNHLENSRPVAKLKKHVARNGLQFRRWNAGTDETRKDTSYTWASHLHLHARHNLAAKNPKDVDKEYTRKHFASEQNSLISLPILLVSGNLTLETAQLIKGTRRVALAELEPGRTRLHTDTRQIHTFVHSIQAISTDPDPTRVKPISTNDKNQMDQMEEDTSLECLLHHTCSTQHQKSKI